MTVKEIKWYMKLWMGGILAAWGAALLMGQGDTSTFLYMWLNMFAFYIIISIIEYAKRGDNNDKR